MPTQIETAQSTDYLKVAALDRISWPERPDTFIPDGEHIWRVWSEYATLLVARQTEADPLPHTADVCGALVMFPTKTGELFLHKIMVHPECRGRRIGTRLMEAALAEADRPVLLTVDPKNDPAVQLYRNMGYEVRERIDGFYRPHEDRFVMVYEPTTSRTP